MRVWLVMPCLIHSSWNDWDYSSLSPPQPSAKTGFAPVEVLKSKSKTATMKLIRLSKYHLVSI